MKKRSARCSKVIGLSKQGFSIATIAARTGYPKEQVKNCVMYWRRGLRKDGASLPQCACGQATNHTGRCIEKHRAGGKPKDLPPDFAEMASRMSVRELRQQYRIGHVTLGRWFVDLGLSPVGRSGKPTLRNSVEALAAEGWSPRTIVRETGGQSKTVRRYVRAWRAKLRAAGKSLPPCRCGATHNHQHFCFEKACLAARAMPVDFPEVARDRTIKELCRTYRAGNKTVSGWLSTRTDILRPRRGQRPRALRPAFRQTSMIDDPLHKLVESYVPNGYAPDVRADLISALYLAVLDGTLRINELSKCGGSILNQTLRECGVHRWSLTTSLDEVIGDDDFSLGDHLVDETAGEAFECLFDGRVL